MNSWIKCEDRMPEGDQVILAIGKYGEICNILVKDYSALGISWHSWNVWSSYDGPVALQDHDNYSESVNERYYTHWMPLPSPPDQ